MTGTTHFKCECQHCGGHLECPAESAGLTTDCPHCGKPTELIAPPPLRKPSAPAKKILFTGIALLIAIVATSMVVAKSARRKEQLRAEAAEAARLDAQQAAEAEARASDPLVQAGWSLIKVRIEKMPDSKIIHAAGTLQNETDHRRFGVKIHLDLFDATDQKIGTATDYQPSIEPHARWQFSALVVNAKTVSAKVAAVEESP